ncbi:MAG: MBL fold metallo-hydrolase RNA specificity domain-containing protein [Promethearchaeota archaeon]
MVVTVATKKNISKNWIQFCGATREVTGSMHLLNFGKKKILIDAGAYQGIDSDQKNMDRLPFDAKEIKYISLSHAHLDHCGRLPILYREGCKAEIIATSSTYEICLRVLEDSLKIQKEEEAKGKPLLFDEDDLNLVKGYFKPLDDENSKWSDGEDLYVQFMPAEHILGSTQIFIQRPISLLYTGDLGGGVSSLHSIPKPPEKCDFLIMESTYGNRVTEKDHSDILKQLKEAINSTVHKGGKLLIPVFSVDRAEEILYCLTELKVKDKVFLDTPMGIDILEIYSREKYHLSKLSKKFDLDSLNKVFHPEKFERLRSAKRSREIAKSDQPAIILASSGMLEGGRVLNHLPYILPDENSAILFTGYQAEGTLGRQILDGTKQVNLDGEEIYIKAKITKIEGLSAHADKNSLIEYIRNFKILPYKIFLVHGELQSSVELASQIQREFKIRTEIPAFGQKFDLGLVNIIEGQTKSNFSIDPRIQLSFTEINDKQIALFLGGIQKQDNNYMLVPIFEIEKMIIDLKKQLDAVKDLKITEMLQISSANSKPVIDIPSDTSIISPINQKTTPITQSLHFDINELYLTLKNYFEKKYISKGLIKSLCDTIESSMAEYKKRIEKRIKNDNLLRDMNYFKSNNIKITPNERKELSQKLAKILIESTKADRNQLIKILNKFYNEII